MTVRQAHALLGRADVVDRQGPTTYLNYILGIERDSIFQIDGEVLSVEFRPGVLMAATIEQT